MVELKQKYIWISLAAIVGSLLILVPLLAWVGGDGMEATFEHFGIAIPDSFYPGIDLGLPFQDYIWAVVVPVSMFFGAIGIFYLMKFIKEKRGSTA
ncbi:MAG: hypothetical protein ACTSRW_16495 [Candidatus Helarchaeota archaeon]